MKLVETIPSSIVDDYAERMVADWSKMWDAEVTGHNMPF